MFSVKRVLCTSVSAVCLLAGVVAGGQSTADIQKTIQAKYNLTKPTASRDDIVTAGDVIVLQKDGLQMSPVTTAIATPNNYKNGKISQNFMFKKFGIPGVPSTSGNSSNRTFVAGEKFWITSIDVKDDGVVFGLMSDPISDVRYYSTLKIQFNKGQAPPASDVAAMADQVFKVQPSDNAKDSGGAAAPAAAPAVPAAAPAQNFAAIPPPPPPADAAAVPPPTIKIGETQDEVKTAFGAPTKVIKLATKEIDIYPDMKVTFVHGKVSDVQ